MSPVESPPAFAGGPATASAAHGGEMPEGAMGVCGRVSDATQRRGGRTAGYSRYYMGAKAGKNGARRM